MCSITSSEYAAANFPGGGLAITSCKMNFAGSSSFFATLVAHSINTGFEVDAHGRA